MDAEQRSGCPINLTLEVVGDKWSLLVIRDMIFGNRRHFRELLTRSQEGIASNILAARLKRLVEAGLLSRRGDSPPRQEGGYNPARKGNGPVALVCEAGGWGRPQLPAPPPVGGRPP